MKKFLCMLLALLMLMGMALAEPEATAAVETPEASFTAETPEASSQPEESAAPLQSPVLPIRIGFEDGFSLELPAGWQYYTITEEMAAQGVLYCLSDDSARRWLYIQSWYTDCTDIDSLQDLIERSSQPQTSGIYTFNGTDFVIYDLVEGDVSCCAALVDGRILNFVFTPHSDAAFMATATQVIGSFGILAE